jgi:MFS superfamily sulfate permease-like transporter
MAKYRHRFFEMYDRREEAVSDLMPKVLPDAGAQMLPESESFQHLVISRAAGVTLVEFKSPATFADVSLKELGDDFALLAETAERHCKIVLDFSGIESVSPGVIEALMQLHGTLKNRGSRLALCALEPAAREAFFTAR